MKPAPSDLCPCRYSEAHLADLEPDSAVSFANCCSPYLSAQLLPETAEQLMRSRYCAYVLKNVDYLIATLYPAQRSIESKELLSHTISATKWLALVVCSTDAPKPSAQKKLPTVEVKEGLSLQSIAWVDFVAYFSEIGAAKEGGSSVSSFSQLHEYSRFVKESGQWYYVDGLYMPPFKLGRNELCWCGSGKKSKHCHASQ